MKLSEVAALLAVAARTDRWIEPDNPAVVERWQHLTAEPWLTPRLALDALDAFQRTETRGVTPADILNRAREIRRDRLSRAPIPDPPREALASPAAWLAACAAAERAIIDGHPPAAVTAAMAAAVRRELPAGGPQ